MTRPDALLAAAEAAPIPRGPDGAPVFAEPWEAQAFALTLALHARGLFTWSEWTEALGAEIRRDEAEGGYYGCWLLATERLAAARGATTPAELSARRDAWDRAAHATPHGEPILLGNDPLRSEGDPAVGRGPPVGRGSA